MAIIVTKGVRVDHDNITIDADHENAGKLQGALYLCLNTTPNLPKEYQELFRELANKIEQVRS